MLIKINQNYIVLGKIFQPGESRYDVMPGQITFAELDSQYRPVSAGKKLFEENFIYEYDAAIALVNNNPRLAIFTATHKGPILNIFDAKMNLVSTIDLVGQFNRNKLSKLSVLATRTKLYVAAVESGLSSKSQVLVGSIELNNLK